MRDQSPKQCPKKSKIIDRTFKKPLPIGHTVCIRHAAAAAASLRFRGHAVYAKHGERSRGNGLADDDDDPEKSLGSSSSSSPSPAAAA